jgi:hypothetical protein
MLTSVQGKHRIEFYQQGLKARRLSARLLNIPWKAQKGTPIERLTSIGSTLNGARSTSDSNAVIAVYDTHREAEVAMKELHTAGFDMKILSFVGKDKYTGEQVAGFYNASDRMKYWGRIGALWDGLWGLLFGAEFLWVPAIGTVVIAGPLSASFAAASESAVGVDGLRAFRVALKSIGIPKDSVPRYATAIKVNKCLLSAHGTAAEVAKAKEMLKRTNPVELESNVLGAAEIAVAS